MSENPPGLQITLPAEAENVAVVRHALAGLAEEIGMDEAAIADLKTVVTEACMNVVVHAYDGDGTARGRGRARRARPDGRRPRLRGRHPPAGRRRARQPADSGCR